MTSWESLSLTSLVSFGLPFLLFSSRFCNFLLCPNLTNMKIKTMLKVEGMEWWNPIIPISFNSFWHLPIILYVNPWKIVAESQKMPGFLASGGGGVNLGPETRLDRSELLCNKVLLKYKRDRKSFWHRHRKGDGECPLASISNGIIYLLISYYSKSKECLEFVKILPDPLPQLHFRITRLQLNNRKILPDPLPYIF